MTNPTISTGQDAGCGCGGRCGCGGCGADCSPDDCTCAGVLGPVQPARHQRPAIGRDHECVIRPEPDASLEARVARLERDVDGLRRKVLSMEPMPG